MYKRSWQESESRNGPKPLCGICLTHFTLKGPGPYLLPCLHAVCETCVTSTAGGVISCSTCQREVNLTETHLEQDVVRLREIFHLTVQHCPSDVLCTHDDDGNQAVCWCQECEKFLCEHCQNLHESFKATKKHAIQNVRDWQPLHQNCERYCHIHENYPLDLWDEDCNMFLCSRCKQCDHGEHNLTDIDVAADAAKADFESKLERVKKVSVHQNALLKKTREELQLADDASDTIRDKINNTFHSLKILLDQREKELIIEFDKHTEMVQSLLESTAEVLQTRYQRCNTVEEYMSKSLFYYSKFDMFKTKNVLEEAIKLGRDSNPPDDQEFLCLPVFETEGIDKLKSTMASFGNIETTEGASTKQQLSRDMATQTSCDLMLSDEEIQTQHKMHLARLNNGFTPLQKKVDELQTRVNDYIGQEKDVNEDCKKYLADKNILAKEFSSFRKTMIYLEEDMTTYTEAVNTVQLKLRTLGLFLEGSRHLLKNEENGKHIILQCPHLKFDVDRVNVRKAHMDSFGMLVNTVDTKPLEHINDRLFNYIGTTGIVSLPRCGSPQYWEVRMRTDIDQPLTGSLLLLETGLCREEERDQSHCISGRPQSYTVNISFCTTHSGLCTKVWRHCKQITCCPETLQNIPGESKTLSYGVAFDDSLCRIAFVDVLQNKLMTVVKGVDCSRPLWPIFGVFNPHFAGVSMSLVVGEDIDMSMEKKALIQEAFFSS